MCKVTQERIKHITNKNKIQRSNYYLSLTVITIYHIQSPINGILSINFKIYTVFSY